MPPAGWFLPDHDAQLVARVEEVRRLRVVRAADHVAVELVLENLGVPPLQPRRGRHPEPGEHLVPVQAGYLAAVSVEVEAVLGEHGLAEADRRGDRVAALGPGPLVGQGRLDRVELGVPRRPVAHRADLGDREADGAGAGPSDLGRGPGDGQDAGAVEQGGGDGRRVSFRDDCRVECRLDLDVAVVAQHVLRAREDVFQKDPRHDVQRHVAVDAARLQVVHRRRAGGLDVGGNVEPARVYDDRQDVVALGHVAGEFGRPGQVAARVGSGRPAVEHHDGVRHDPIEGHQDPRARDGGAGEVLAVYPDVLP